MDRPTLKARAKDVSATLASFLQAQADALADDQEEQNVRLAAALRANSDKLDERQSARDSSGHQSDVAAKTKALRDDVQRFGAERDAATVMSISAAVMIRHRSNVCGRSSASIAGRSRKRLPWPNACRTLRRWRR